MKVVFLDRDGTVVEEPHDHRIDGVEKIKLFPDSIAALKHLADNDFSVVFITNQAGIGEGRITEDEYWELHGEVLRQLEPSGANILKTYMNGEADTPTASQWRKPGPNMLLQAAKDLDLDLGDIYMVGDSLTDVEAAINAGCKGGILLQTTYGDIESAEAVYIAPTLMDAARFVVEN